MYYYDPDVETNLIKSLNQVRRFTKIAFKMISNLKPEMLRKCSNTDSVATMIEYYGMDKMEFADTYENNPLMISSDSLSYDQGILQLCVWWGMGLQHNEPRWIFDWWNITRSYTTLSDSSVKMMDHLIHQLRSVVHIIEREHIQFA